MNLPKQQLYAAMRERFNKEELRILCFNLGIDPEDLDEKTIHTMTQSFLLLIEKQGKISSLLPLLERERPGINWSEIVYSKIKSPYRGLLPFRKEDAHLYFGRDRYISTLYEMVEKKPFIPVIGPSGSGKSSLVFAGLEPLLLQTGQWQTINTRLRETPFLSLAGELLPILEPELSRLAQIKAANQLAADLISGKLTLRQVIARIEKESEEQRRILLIVDQFEELYTHSTSTDIQEKFLNALFDLQNQSFVTVLITLRADFLGQVLASRFFADVVQESGIMIGPMNREELYAVMQRPLTHTFVTFESGLITKILDDVGHEPGNLPLLEFALTSLWEQREDGRLTFATYESIGGIAGALTEYAEEIFAPFAETETAKQIRRLFVQLVQPTANAAKRTAKRAELSDELWALATQLADSRLLVTGQDENGEEIAELAHEALITHWQRFAGWIKENLQFRTRQERLRSNLKQWHNHDRSAGFLLREGQLVVGRELLTERKDELSSLEIDFIEASITADEQRQAEEDVRRRRELENAQALAEAETKRAEEQAEAARILRTRAIYLGAALMTTVLLGIVSVLFFQAARQSEQDALASERTAVTAAAVAVAAQATAEAEADVRAAAEAASEARRIEAEENQIEANKQSQLAFSRFLAAQAPNLLETNNTLALLLSIEAANRDRGLVDEMAAGAALHEILNAPGITTAVFDHETDEGILNASWNPIDTHLATSFCAERNENNACVNSFVTIWDVINAEKNLVVEFPAFVQEIVWSPDGEKIYIATNDNNFHIWNIQTAETITVAKAVNAVSWSKDSAALMTATRGSGVFMWDASTGEALPNRQFLAGEPVFVARWDQNEERILTASCEENDTTDCQGIISIWNVDAPEQPIIQFDVAETAVKTAAWSPDEQYILTGDENGLIALWDAETGAAIAEQMTIPNEERAIKSVQWSPDGTRFLAVANRGVALWELSTLEELITDSGETDATTETAVIKETGPDVTIPEEIPPQPAIYFFHFKGSTTSLAWSNDGTRLLLGTLNAAQIWSAQNQTAEPEMNLIGHGTWVNDVAWSQNDRLVATAGGDGTVRLWMAEPGYEIAPFTHNLRIRDAELAAQRNLLISGSADDTAKLWDVEKNELLFTFSPNIGTIYSVAWNPVNQLVAASGYENVLIWDSQNPAVAAYTLAHEIETWIEKIVWNPKGDHLLTISDDDKAILTVWDLSDDAPESIALIGHELGKTISTAAWHPNDNWIVSAGEDRAIRLWNAKTGELLQTLPQDGWVWHVEWNDTGDILLATTELGAVKLWESDPATGRVFDEEPYKILPVHDVRVFYASWNETETKILSVSADDSAVIHNLETAETIKFTGHTADVNWAEWNTDETLILTAGADGTARIWDAETGTQLAVLGGHTDYVRQGFWLDDDTRVLTYGEDGTIRQYYVELDELVTAACRVIPRNMTQQEWESYMADEEYAPSCP
jgi:WD40 repeat protein/energy-coupling factor transporter ATP-binding protein EcfA2